MLAIQFKIHDSRKITSTILLQKMCCMNVGLRVELLVCGGFLMHNSMFVNMWLFIA